MFVITGASSGIGRATAGALARRGSPVLAVARREDQLFGLQQECGPNIQVLPADLSTESGVDRLVSTVAARGSLSGIVHGAGSKIEPSNYRDVQPADLVEHFRIHVATPIEINNRLGEFFDDARVVYIDSFSATEPRIGWSGYSIVKAGAQMAARAAAVELDGATVIRFFPGGVRTPLVEAILDSPNSSPARATFRELAKAGELTEPELIGTYLAQLLLDTPTATLTSRAFWDYSDPTAPDPTTHT